MERIRVHIFIVCVVVHLKTTESVNCTFSGRLSSRRSQFDAVINALTPE